MSRLMVLGVSGSITAAMAASSPRRRTAADPASPKGRCLPNRKLLASTLFAVLSAAASAAAPAAEKLTTLQWKMSLSAEGRITALVPSDVGIEALYERLEPAIRRWEFVPGQLDGKSAATDTLLFVELALVASPNGKEYSVRVKDARTGGSVANAIAPRMSRASADELARRRGAGAAMVAVEVAYDATGKAIETSVAAGSSVQIGALVVTAKKAVAKWTYVPERVAGAGVPGKLIVPICFVLASSQAEARRSCRWTQPGTDASVEQGQSLALDSRVQIKTEVVDSML